MLPPSFDALYEYECASGQRPRAPTTAVRGDPLAGRPAAQAARRKLAARQCGANVRQGWERLVAGQIGPFVRAYVLYLSCA